MDSSYREHGDRQVSFGLVKEAISTLNVRVTQIGLEFKSHSQDMGKIQPNSQPEYPTNEL